MQEVALRLRGKPFRKFSSICQFLTYVLDILIRLVILALFAFAGGAYTIVRSPDSRLGNYVWLYCAAITAWGLLLVKFVIARKKVFGKTKFDLHFMGLLTILLLSSLVAEDRVRTVFGSSDTWSYSIITFLSISIVYYITVLVFRYGRGVKWLSLGFVLSVVLAGIYHIALILSDQKPDNLDYMNYAVFAIPLAIGIILLFRKIHLKVFAFLGLLLSLFLVAYYSSYLKGGIFMLGVGVLSLFLLFYFSFWVRHGEIIIDFVKEVMQKVRNIRELKEIFNQNKGAGMILVMMLLMALWIIGLIFFNWRYYKLNIGPFLASWISDDVEKIDTLKMWLIGNPDLASRFSSMEVLNILSSYGILAMFGVLFLLLSVVVVIGKLTLRLLYSGSFRNVILLSSMFVTSVSIFICFLLSRFTPSIYLLLVFVSAIFAIIDDLVNKKEVYSLEECREKVTTKGQLIRAVLAILIIGVTISGVIGVLLGIDKGIFEVGASSIS